jgi:HK97 family phage major capsid protein
MKTYFENEIAELRKQAMESNDVNEVRSLTAKIEEKKAMLDKVIADEQKRSFNPLASYSVGGANKSKEEDPEMRSRLDFANYVTRGVMTPEMRATTNTTNTAPAIPSNLLNRIIENIEAIGMILSIVTRTAYPVGQSIPVDSTKPTATWVAEGAGSTPQLKSTLGTIVFGAFKLRCEVRMTHEVTVKTISAFESLFVKQVSEAMVKAIESKIISADAGASNPTGILYDAKGADKHVDVAKGTTGKLTYKLLCDAEGELPQQYEAGAKWFMSKKTFMQFVGMTDTNGQPVARVNYGIGGKPERTLLGRDVVLTGTYLADYTETATKDEVFAFLFDPTDYVLNTSYDLGLQRKQDWDTEDHCIKAVMSVDGKVLDRTSLVKLVKKYA